MGNCSLPRRLSFLDRTNIGNAKLFRLQEDLHMPTKGPGSLQYNTALAVFFPFYVAAEIPSNMMMKRLRPSLWLTIIMLSVFPLILTELTDISYYFQGLEYLHHLHGFCAQLCRSSHSSNILGHM